jgi:hypothetical protein
MIQAAAAGVAALLRAGCTLWRSAALGERENRLELLKTHTRKWF